MGIYRFVSTKGVGGFYKLLIVACLLIFIVL